MTRRYLCFVVVVLFVGFFAVACGEALEGSGTRRDYTSTSVELPADSRCSADPGTPLTVLGVRDALAERGFALEPVFDPVCGGDVVAELSNIHFEGLNQNLGRHREIRESVGHIRCHVNSRPIRISGEVFRDPTVVREGVPETEIVYENVSCAIYPAGNAPNEQVKRFREAFDRSLPDVAAR